MPKIVNRAYMTTATTGTGTITLGSAVGSFRSFAASGVVDGDVVRYVIEDGDNWEIGSGTYAATGTTLTRAVEDSSSGGTAITLSGTAVVFVTAVAADFGGGDALGTVTGADLDLSTGNFFEVTAADQTLTFSNPPAAHGFTVKVTGAGTVSGYDLLAASYDNISFSVAAQEITPNALFFKPNGLKMYIVGSTGDNVSEYDLSAAWDISTAVYLQSFSVGAQEVVPTGLFFRDDGLKMYICGTNGDDVNEYNLSTAWDVSTASFLQNFSVLAQEASVADLFFKPDGLKMYIIGSDGDAVDEYDLSVAWDISTANFSQLFSVAALASSPADLFFKPDGLKMYIIDLSSDNVIEYNLSTAWDVSTASFLRQINLRADIGSTALPQGLFFRPDGLKMFVVDSTTDAVFQYTTGSFTTATITYPASVTFEAGSPPAAPAIGAVKTVDLYTVNGGTNYYDKG